MRSELRALRERIRQVEDGGHRDTLLRRAYNHKLRAHRTLQGGGGDKINIIHQHNDDINTTINDTLLVTISTGMVDDTFENRANAALVCMSSLYQQLLKLQSEVKNLREHRTLQGGGGGQIYINRDNIDINDTIRPLLNTISTGMVDDTPENRANAALVCISSLYRQLGQLKETVYKLKNEGSALSAESDSLATDTPHLKGGGQINIIMDNDNKINKTINDTLLSTISKGEVDDTFENRANAALVCISSFYRQLLQLQSEVTTLNSAR